MLIDQRCVDQTFVEQFEREIDALMLFLNQDDSTGELAAATNRFKHCLPDAMPCLYKLHDLFANYHKAEQGRLIIDFARRTEYE